MPVSLPPISRRQFLTGSVAGAAAVVIAPRLRAAGANQDPNRFALFSDTHIAADQETVLRDTNMAANLRQAIAESLAVAPRPAGAMVSGDCALTKGQSGDYRSLVEIIQPLRAAKMPIHFALGNHDNRARFITVVKEGKAGTTPVVGKYITIVESPFADWILLDSLDHTNSTPGVLGKLQLDWLDQTLTARRGKPIFVMVHHNPDPRPQPTGLVETKELLDLLTKHTLVKALFFGHSHHWSVSRHQKLHLINLPAVAYVFAKGEPNGWVDARLRSDGLQLTLNCIAKQHPRNGEVVNLKWQG